MLVDAKVIDLSDSYTELLLTVSVVHATPISGLGSMSRRHTLYFSIPIPQDRTQQATDCAKRLTTKSTSKP